MASLHPCFEHTAHVYLVLGGGRERSAGRKVEGGRGGKEGGDLILVCTIFTAHAKISAHMEMQLQTQELFNILFRSM